MSDVERWQEGNTSARSLERIATALRVLRDDGLLVAGATTDIDAWTSRARIVLDRTGASRSAAKGNDKTAGPKFLSVAESYGFVRARLAPRWRKGGLEGWDKLAGQITSAGERLVDAATGAEAEAVFREALALRVMGRPLETTWGGRPLNTFGLTLSVLLALERRDGNEAFLSPFDFAAILQTEDGSRGADEIAAGIVAFRCARHLASDRRKFDDTALKVAAQATATTVKPATLTSYANVTISYSASSGLCERRRQGRVWVLRLVDDPGMRRIAEAIAARPTPPAPTKDLLGYLTRLEEGGPSWDADPMGTRGTDNLPAVGRSAELVRRILAAMEAGTGLGLGTARRRVQSWSPDTFAAEQALVDNPCAAWPDARKMLLRVIIDRWVPVDGLDRSMAFEWTMMRAGALLVGPGGTTVPAAEMRGYGIADDLLPVGHAPGGVPDVKIVCGPLAIPIEATLTHGSRQAGTEAESVRRHVAAVRTGSFGHDEVIGIFVAPSLDMNVVEWFQRGWHWQGRERVQSDVVPLDVNQVLALCDAAHAVGGGSASWFGNFLRACISDRNGRDEFGWLDRIAARVHEAVGSVSFRRGNTAPGPAARNTGRGSARPPAHLRVVPRQEDLFV